MNAAHSPATSPQLMDPPPPLEGSITLICTSAEAVTGCPLHVPDQMSVQLYWAAHVPVGGVAMTVKLVLVGKDPNIHEGHTVPLDQDHEPLVSVPCVELTAKVRLAVPEPATMAGELHKGGDMVTVHGGGSTVTVTVLVRVTTCPLHVPDQVSVQA